MAFFFNLFASQYVDYTSRHEMEDAVAFSPEKIRTWIPGWVRVVAVGLILVFLVAALVNGYDQIAQIEWHLNLPVLVLSLTILIVYMVIHGALWTWMVRQLGLTLSYRSGVQMFLWSQLAKYIPGGVWAFASVGISAAQRGLPVGATIFSYALSMILVVCVSSLYAIPVAISFVPLEVVIGLVVFGIVILLVVIPGAIRFFIKPLGHRRQANEPVLVERLLQSRQILLLILLYGLTHILAMVSFAFYYHGVVGSSLSQSIYASFAWSGAWVIGFLFLIAPSGLGVREGAMLVLLSPVLPAPVAIAVAFGFRLFTTILDMVLLVILIVFTRLSNLLEVRHLHKMPMASHHNPEF